MVFVYGKSSKKTENILKSVNFLIYNVMTKAKISLMLEWLSSFGACKKYKSRKSNPDFRLF